MAENSGFFFHMPSPFLKNGSICITASLFRVYLKTPNVTGSEEFLR